MEMIKENLPESYHIYERSVRENEGARFALVKNADKKKFLSVLGEAPAGLEAAATVGKGRLYPLTPKNARALQQVFPWLRPTLIDGGKPSFGFGDRLGLATPGHVRAARGRNFFPVFAQQSIREMDRTGMTPEEVMAAAVWGVFQEGYTGGFGADADHLKTIADLGGVIAAGFTLYTCDPGDHVNDSAAALPPDALRREFERLEGHEKLRAEYLNRRFELRDPEHGDVLQFEFTGEDLRRTAVKYLRAVHHAIAMHKELSRRLNQFDYEVSVDETQSPTTPIEHFFIARELQRAGVSFIGVALRFVGEFQKGIDYIGDRAALEQQLQAHAAITRALGPYRISVHSGSDKFSIYPLVRKHFGSLFHVKTAGTSYLEALHLLALDEPHLFRDIYRFALTRYDDDKRTYHVARHPRVPKIETVSDEQLAGLLEQNDVRQLLHVTYGSVLNWRDEEGNRSFRDRLLRALNEHEEHYNELVRKHFDRHLDPLK
jgi:hypothetical protein